MHLHSVVISNNINYCFIKVTFHLGKHKLVFFPRTDMGYMWPWRSSLILVYYRDLSFRIKAFSTISAGDDLSLFLLQFLLWQIWYLSRVHTVWQLHGVESVPYFSISTWPCSLFWLDAKFRATCFYDGLICAAAEALAQKKASERQMILSWIKPSVRVLRCLYEGSYDL